MVTIAGRSWITIVLNIFGCKTDIVTFIDHSKDFTFVALKNITFLSKYFSTILYKDLV